MISSQKKKKNSRLCGMKMLYKVNSRTFNTDSDSLLLSLLFNIKGHLWTWMRVELKFQIPEGRIEISDSWVHFNVKQE